MHPQAAHPLLARLGAVEATARGMLTDPAVRAAVEASYDEEDPWPVADAVLSLVAAARLRPGDEPWLADLALPGDDGEWYPAGELLLPGGPLATVVAADTPFGTAGNEVVERYGAETLAAAGVLATFGLLTAPDVPLDAPDLDLDQADEWAADTTARLPGGVPPVAPEVLAVRDLELVDPARWPQALELLAAPPLRAALVEPTRVLLASGRTADVPSYTAWWLRRHPVLGGREPAEPARRGQRPAARGPVRRGRAAGRRRGGQGAGRPHLAGRAAGRARRTRRTAGPAGRPRPPGQPRAAACVVGGAGRGVPEADAPERVRAVRGAEIVVADARDTLVLDAPDLWPLAAADPLILAPFDRAARLADLLDLPLVSEEFPARVESAPRPRPVPDIVAAVLPGAPESYCEHDQLVVDGVPLPWRYADGVVHADGPEGLARGLAWAAGRWPARHLLAALLRDPGQAARLLAEADLDPGQ